MKAPGRVAYEAYRTTRTDQTPLPEWDQLTESIHLAWTNAASAVLSGPYSGSVIELIAQEAAEEVHRAEDEHHAYNSLHEAIAVLWEETDELWDEIKKKRSERDKARIRAELLQVAAVAIRTIYVFQLKG